MAQQSEQEIRQCNFVTDHLGTTHENGTKSDNNSKLYNIISKQTRQKKTIWIICCAIAAVTVAVIIVVAVLKSMGLLGTENGLLK